MWNMEEVQIEESSNLVCVFHRKRKRILVKLREELAVHLYGRGQCHISVLNRSCHSGNEQRVPLGSHM